MSVYYRDQNYLNIEATCLRTHQTIRAHVQRECERLKCVMPPVPRLVFSPLKETSKGPRIVVVTPEAFAMTTDNAPHAFYKAMMGAWRASIQMLSDTDLKLPEWTGEPKTWQSTLTAWLKAVP